MAHMNAQDCGPEVPVLNVDLTSGPDATFLSPGVVRAGNCCGTSAPDRCIAFDITLHEGAQGIIFDICSGAVPPGALFYQINCGPPIPVGGMICLDGIGPHYLTFCKPGNNQNQYCITSVPAPTAGPDTLASEGCSAVLTSSGYDPSSVVWTSVNPGIQGSLDGLLSCTQCENPEVTAPVDEIAFADFMVCGLPLGGCDPMVICDTVRVSFASTLAVTIEPDPPAICEGQVDVVVTATGSGGYPPYTFAWSNGTTGNTTSITSPGTYSVQISDGSGCPPAAYSFEVTQYSQPVGADAGPDQLVCSLDDPIQLAGSFFGTDSAKWSGGDGTFIPNDQDPEALYIPSPEEVEAGTITLTLGVLPGGDCPGTTDQVVITISPYDVEVTMEVEHISCFGANDGSIALETNEEGGPYDITWDQPGLTGFNQNNLAPGTYSATISNTLGCTEEITVDIEEPQILEVIIIAQTDPLCHNSGDGHVEIEISGGTPPYEINWSAPAAGNTTVANNLGGGTHSVEVVDANGCTNQVGFTLLAPTPIYMRLTDTTITCMGDVAILNASASGGTGNYVYHWNPDLGNSPDHTVELDNSEVFTVFVTDENGCSSDVVEIEVVVLPEADQLAVAIEPELPVICAGETEVWVTASATGGYPPYQYAWSNGSTSNSILINAPGTYYVEVGDGTFCSPVVHSFEVFAYDQPVSADAGPDQLVCDLSVPIQLEGSITGADSAMWSGGEGIFTPNVQDLQALYEPSMAEIAAGEVTLTLMVMPGGDCPGTTDEVRISIAPFNGDVEMSIGNISCFGANDGYIDIEVTGEDGPYSIEWDQPGLGGFEVSGLPPGNYSALLFNELGCPEAVEVTLTQPSELLVEITEWENPLCHDSEDGSASISIDGGTVPYEIVWTPQADNNGTSAFNLPAGDNTATVTDANGCQVTTAISLIAPPEVFIEVADSMTVCIGNAFEIQATAWGGSGDFTYTWSHGLGNASAHAVNPVDDTVYSVFATDENGCSTPPSEIAVTVISMSPDLLWMSPDTGICMGQWATVEARYEGAHPPYTYTWEPALPVGPGPHTVQPENTTIYHLTVNDVCGNSITNQVQVEIYPLPEIDLADLLLTGCYPTDFSLHDTVNVGEEYVHTWRVDGLTLNGNPAIFQPEGPGIFEVELEVQSANGCTSVGETPLLIEVYPSPVARFGTLPSIGYIDEPDFSFFNQSEGVVSTTTWTVENELFEQMDTLYYTFADTGVYTIQLRVENEYGCADSTIKRVTVLPVYNVVIPNAFTPSGTGGGGYYDPASTANTIFYPFAEYVSEIRMNIFNRWGELIFESNEFEFGWDGTYRDQPCPQDVYVYKIDFVFADGVKMTRVGDLTLFR